MQNINLMDAALSDVKYEIIEFSDGESHLKFTTEINRKDRVRVLTRISSMRDLFILMQVADILNRMEVEWALIVTYLMGMRMDRVISFNEAYTLKIVAKAINDMNASCVYVVEPHSDKTTSLINNCIAIENRYIQMAEELAGQVNYIIVFPDAGAKERYGGKVTSLPVLTCQKKRDPNTGALSGFAIENPEVIESLPDGPEYAFLVIDDLCDGGGTFCGIAELLAKAMPNASKTLAVTHAVSLKGIVNVNNHYDSLLISDSYKDWGSEEYVKTHENVKVVPVVDGYLSL